MTRWNPRGFTKCLLVRLKGFSEGSDNPRRGAQVTRMIAPTKVAPYREDARVPHTATNHDDMLEIVRPLACATTRASCGTWQVEGRGHINLQY